ncbi:hypothetical protein [Halopiger goleimassiliensis]|uniref:hypothetical protein n=1 Tax=Halopiger goleimassiliensis TaxID=1293048 RepID=UPI00067819CD|nr:hypothetical protein [Halopiger goleimassiliensis]
MTSRRSSIGTLLLVGAILLTAVVYGWLVPTHALDDDHGGALLYLTIGWVPYTLVFYLVGRRFSAPSKLPNMRAADAGLGLFLISLLLSLGLDAWGFEPELVPQAHVLQAMGIFVGLALFGWGIGRRSKAVSAYE